MDWQVESGKRLTVFVSATTADLGSYRQLVRNILLDAGIYPVVQDHFGPDDRTIQQLISEKILSADAVICLVGCGFGTPVPDTTGTLKSYTQFEFELAMRFGRRCFLFVADNGFAADHEPSECDAFRANQDAYRNTILTGAQKYELFASRADLDHKIRAAILPILIGSRRRNMIYQHPPAEPAAFVGRDDELQQLTQAITEHSPAVIAVIGMAGQGKTSLVAHAVKKLSPLPVASGFWVCAGNLGFSFSHFLDEALSAFLATLYDRAALPDPASRLTKLIRYMQGSPTLIVIDSVECWLRGWNDDPMGREPDEAASRSGADGLLDEFFRQTTCLENGSHVIAVGRSLPSALDSLHCRIIPVLPAETHGSPLQGLSQTAAVHLLELSGVEAPPDVLVDIASRLAWHPLALTCFAKLASRLGGQWPSLWTREAFDPRRIVYRLLDEALHHLLGADGSITMLKAACLCEEDVPLDLLSWLCQCEARGQPPAQEVLVRWVIILADWNIVTWLPQSFAISFHPLVREYLCSLLTESEAARFHARLATWYAGQPCDRQSASLAAVHPSMLAVRHMLAAGQPERAIQIMFAEHQGDCGLYGRLTAHGHHWECAELLGAIERRVQGTTKGQCILARAGILHDIGLLHTATHDLDRALEEFHGGEENSDTTCMDGAAKCLAYKGIIAADTAKASDAIALYDKAIGLFEILRKADPAAVADQTRTYVNRGIAYAAAGEWNCAAADYSAARSLLGIVQSAAADGLRHDIVISQALLDLDMGEAAAARDGLAAELAAFSASAPQHTPFLRCTVALAAAHNQAGDAMEAEHVASIAIETIDAQGLSIRDDAADWLAQAYASRARARLTRNSLADARQDATSAIELYRRRIAKGAHQLEGRLSEALYLSAEANCRSGAFEAFSGQLQQALEISRRWIGAWLCECSIAAEVLQQALNALSYIPPGQTADMQSVLDIVYVLGRSIAAKENPSQALRHVAALLVCNEQRWSNAARLAGMH